MSGRLKKSPDEVVQRLIIEPGLAKELSSHYEYFLDINTAHLLSLTDQGLLPEEEAAQIQRATEDMRMAGPEALPLSPRHEDLYFTIESDLIRRTGPELGGKLHTGRSRNDILATVARLRARRELSQALERLLELRATLLTLAQEHTDSVISGYTHLQAAEPITLGHYFAAVLQSLERDSERLLSCLNRIDRSPLGSGAMASTTFPLDRGGTAELLGFETVAENSLDAVASRDFAVEMLSTLTLMTNSLSRFAQDLHIWNTSEFSYAEVDSGIAVTSSIMPQKKNPVTLEHIKGKTSHVEGALVSILSSLKSSAYSHSRESGVEALRFTWEGAAEASSAVELFTHTLRMTTFDTERMRAAAAFNFSCVTEVANELVRHQGIPFRTAHHIVGSLVSHCLDRGLTAQDITSEMIAEVATSHGADPASLSPELVARALDPLSNVEARLTRGGPAPTEVSRQISLLRERAEGDALLLDEVTQRWKEAKDELRQRTISLTER